MEIGGVSTSDDFDVGPNPNNFVSPLEGFSYEEVLAAAEDLDNFLAPILAAHATTVIRCDRLGGAEMTLGNAINTIWPPSAKGAMIIEGPASVISEVQGMLANQVVEVGVPAEEAEPEVGEIAKAEEIDRKSEATEAIPEAQTPVGSQKIEAETAAAEGTKSPEQLVSAAEAYVPEATGRVTVENLAPVNSSQVPGKAEAAVKISDGPTRTIAADSIVAPKAPVVTSKISRTSSQEFSRTGARIGTGEESKPVEPVVKKNTDKVEPAKAKAEAEEITIAHVTAAEVPKAQASVKTAEVQIPEKEVAPAAEDTEQFTVEPGQQSSASNETVVTLEPHVEVGVEPVIPTSEFASGTDSVSAEAITDTAVSAPEGSLESDNLVTEIGSGGADEAPTPPATASAEAAKPNSVEPTSGQEASADQQAPDPGLLVVDVAVNAAMEAVAGGPSQLDTERGADSLELPVVDEANDEAVPTPRSTIELDESGAVEPKLGIPVDQLNIEGSVDLVETGKVVLGCLTEPDLEAAAMQESLTHVIAESDLLDLPKIPVPPESSDEGSTNFYSLEVATEDLEENEVLGGSGSETEEVALTMQARDEPDSLQQAEITIPEGLIRTSAPIEGIEDTLVQLTKQIETSEPETTKKANEILDKILEVSAELNTDEGEGMVSELEIQGELRELFAELLIELEIEHTPELVESLARLTLKLHLADEIEKLKNEEEINKARQGTGTHELIATPVVGIDNAKNGIAHAYAIGKSALQLYLSQVAPNKLRI